MNENKLTMAELVATGAPEFHDKMEACDIVDPEGECYRVASMEVMLSTGEVKLLCDVHYLIYLSYVGMVRESKL